MATSRLAPEKETLQSPSAVVAAERVKRNRLGRKFLWVLSLIIADSIGLALALGTAIVLFPQLNLHSARFDPFTTIFRLELRFAWIWLLILVFLAAEGLYTQRRTVWNELAYTLKALTLGSLSVGAIIVIAPPTRILSGTTVLLASIFLFAFVPVTRVLAKRILFACGLWRKRILILGASDTALLAIAGLCSDPVFGYEPVGLLTDDTRKIGKTLQIGECTRLPVLGRPSEARQWIQATSAEDVMIAEPEMREEDLFSMVFELQPVCESVLVIPRLWAFPTMNLEVDGFFRERVLLFKVSNNLAKPWNIWLKRAFDLAFGTLVLCLAAPVFLVVALLIKFDSKGPVFFRQDRPGLRGVIFQCLKFRTMYVDSAGKLDLYIRENPTAREEWQTYAKLRTFDPRVTKVGRWLRRWSLDELPQLINVIKGEMSLVGPRPYLVEEVPRIGDYLPTILSARPGLTGLWQVHGRNHLTFETRVQLEDWYVRHWGIWLDCIVLVKTLNAVFASSPQVQTQWVED